MRWRQARWFAADYGRDTGDIEEAIRCELRLAEAACNRLLRRPLPRSARVPEALRQAGMRVEIHDDHFPPDAEDADGLRIVGQRGWAVLTKDERIRRRPLERRALIDAGVCAFALTARRMSGSDIGQAFVRARARSH